MRKLLLSLSLLLSQEGIAEPAALRFSVSESWSMPLMHLENHQPTSGILLEIFDSLARQVGRQAEYHVMPRLRIQGALESADIDVRCYIAKSWLGDLRGDYAWSVPILVQRDLLVAAPLTVGPYPEQFDNEVIGTVTGYNYPALQHLFDSHRLVREDARNQEQVLRMLVAGRYNYAISNQLAMDWINRELPPEQRLKVVATVSEQDAACLVRKDPALPVQQILDTLQAMRKSGEIQRIVERYAPRR
ncbi:transporter substrate-binding domain-containing protein [Pseudomonas sp. DTU_2021_1001937_2_SI_NGA_ILE_001]|uniref:substrate-binding periplasmic protein n=1 Tax=Pseudomonas sp. DTU_2021_1001937_2_SI_NGA_ILE_001 TaxID=3077589 RepID=UPI0028FC10C8|nr:transporter substrate-binding domain-containing protein [Pseudomonas sp. DTU_2021_1001937_2_SI_NGA_ILE_001]WNW10976.1 transporter substrate-binding domain-containing protein [Pseudomonas sp. DTU_2021_1001937_2_SI_NGA_ILE_001]